MFFVNVSTSSQHFCLCGADFGGPPTSLVVIDKQAPVAPPLLHSFVKCKKNNNNNSVLPIVCVRLSFALYDTKPITDCKLLNCECVFPRMLLSAWSLKGFYEGGTFWDVWAKKTKPWMYLGLFLIFVFSNVCWTLPAFEDGTSKDIIHCKPFLCENWKTSSQKPFFLF